MTKAATAEAPKVGETTTISGQKFRSITDELYRYYEFVRGGQLVQVTIADPELVHVRKSGAHTVIDKKGIAHYIPSDFCHLAWENKEGTPRANF